VVRYSGEHKDATRQRIIEAAGRRLKADGIDGSGVATLMKDAGLTNGAFYAHFASKDDLVGAAIADQLDIQRAVLEAIANDRAGLEAFVRVYLSPEHRDDRSGGCPSAALLDEIARSSEATRSMYTDGLLAIVDHVAAIIEPDDPSSARGRTLAVFASIIGSMQLARALDDPDLSAAVLEEGTNVAFVLLRSA
jgi:TetR/AcrR family transcriptional repressor of nem operon